MSIRARLILLVLVAVVPFVALTIHDLRDRFHERHDAVERRALSVARLLAARLDDHLDDIDSLLVEASDIVAVDAASLRPGPGWSDTLQARLPPEYRMVEVNPLAGRPSEAVLSMTVIPPLPVRPGARQTLTFARTILGAGGRPIAAATLTLGVDSLQHILDPGGLPPRSEVNLFDEHGILLAREPDAEHWTGSDWSRLPFVREALLHPEGVEPAVGRDGIRRLSGFASTHTVPWRVHVSIPTAVVDAEERVALWHDLVVVAATLLLALALASVLGSLTTRPLRRLASDAAALSAGDLSRRSAVSSGDEVGELALAFNRMAAALERRTSDLADRERQYRELFEENPLPMIVYAEEDLRILDVNQAALEHYGWTRAEFLRLTIDDIRPPEDVPALHAYLAQAPAAHRHPGVWRHRRKDGSTMDVELTSHAIGFAGRRARIVLVNDVTERLLNEQAMRRFTEELEQRVERRTAELQEANQELETFSFSVSHDLRAPLRSIEGFARMLEERVGSHLDTEGHRLLGVITANARRMAQLIDDMLAFSRSSRQPLRAASVDMTRLATEAWAEVQAQAGGRALRFTLGELPPARGDRAMLRQVLVNLLSNAAKYTRGRPVALVSMQAHEAGEQIEYYVRDNGTGFDPAHSGRLFQMFQRLHSAEEFEGTGAGLAIVARIVRRHGGRVWAEGMPDGGATFHFTLPRVPAEPDGSPDPEIPRPSGAA